METKLLIVCFVVVVFDKFITQTSNYQSNVQTTNVDPSLVRNSISFTDGMGKSDRSRYRLLNYKDFKQFQ